VEISTVANNINKYRIDIDKFAYSKTKENKKSKKYQYDIYEKGRLLKSIVLEKMNIHFFHFRKQELIGIDLVQGIKEVIIG
jgi:hypothetical protein